MADATLKEEPASSSVYGRVAQHEILLHDGVVRMAAYRPSASVLRRPFEWFGRTPGVSVRVDAAGRLHFKASIIVRYGYNAKAVGAQVQQTIRDAVHRISDRQIAGICVVVAGTCRLREKPKETAFEEPTL